MASDDEDEERAVGEIYRASEKSKQVLWTARRKDRRLFGDVIGGYRYRTCLVLYMDDLGAKALTYDDTQLTEDLERLDALNDELHEHFYDDGHQRLVTFSDNRTLVVPLVGSSDRETHDRLLHVVAGAARFQLQTVIQRRGLRGGLVIGDAFADSSFVQGPALIEAVRLEEQVAIVPRVVVAPEVAGLLEDGRTDSASALYKVQDRGQVIIDYLAETFGGRGQGFGYLVAHRDAVERHLAAAIEGGSDRVIAKWQWTVDFHNRYVRSYLGDASGGLLIDGGVGWDDGGWRGSADHCE